MKEIVIGRNMRYILLRIVTAINTFFTKRLKVHESVFVLNHTFVGKGCSVELNNAYMSHVDLHFEGRNNKLLMDGSRYLRGEIKIFGENNTVEIGKGGYLAQLRIVVRGNNCKVSIGDDVTTGSAYIACMGKGNYVVVGDDCMIAENVDIWATDTHGIYDHQNNLINMSSPVILGKHVWLGKRVSVLKGVSIGDGAIVGMKALVTKDIKAGTLNVGSPSKTIRENVSWKRGFIEM